LIPGVSTGNGGQVVWNGSAWVPNVHTSQFYAPPAQAIPFAPPPGYFAPGWSYPAAGILPTAPIVPAAPTPSVTDPFAYGSALIQQPSGGPFDLTASQLVQLGAQAGAAASATGAGATGLGSVGIDPLTLAALSGSTDLSGLGSLGLDPLTLAALSGSTGVSGLDPLMAAALSDLGGDGGFGGDF
jgi:hypothetical protein